MSCLDKDLCPGKVVVKEADWNALVERIAQLEAELAKAYEHNDYNAQERRKLEAALDECEQTPVEIWRGNRKLSIYRHGAGANVLRVWGEDMNNQMSDVPYSHQAVQDALDWLYSSVETPAEPVGWCVSSSLDQLIDQDSYRYPMTGAYAPRATCKHGVHPFYCQRGCDPNVALNTKKTGEK